MELDILKLKRLCEGSVGRRVQRTTKRLTTDEKGRQVYVDQPGATQGAGRKKSGGGVATNGGAAESVESDEPSLDEGEKHKTPAFVRHCVTAITEKPETLARVQAGGPDGEKGSPFAICVAAYKKKTRQKAADHAQNAKGEKPHHTVKQYEKALATLREDLAQVRRQNVDRSQIIHSDVNTVVTPSNRRLIRYTPR